MKLWKSASFVVLALSNIAQAQTPPATTKDKPEPTLAPVPLNATYQLAAPYIKRVQGGAVTPEVIYEDVVGADGKPQVRVHAAEANAPAAWALNLVPQFPNTHFAYYGYQHINSPSDPLGAALTSADDSLRVPLDLPADRGLVVTNVVPNGPAANIGLQPNDILLTLGEKPLGDTAGLEAALKAVQGNSNDPKIVTISLMRGGKTMTLPLQTSVKIAVAPAPVEEKPTYFIGVTTNSADETLRSHLSLPAGSGLVVISVLENSPALQYGIQKGDILLSYNAKPLADSEVLRSLIQEAAGKPATLEYLRKGKPGTVVVTPRKREAETAAASTMHQSAEFALREKLLAELQQALAAKELKHTMVDLEKANSTVFLFDQAKANPADLSKKIDDLAAQIQALSKVVEELRKEKK